MSSLGLLGHPAGWEGRSEGSGEATRSGGALGSGLLPLVSTLLGALWTALAFSGMKSAGSGPVLPQGPLGTCSLSP